ncbi:MAG: hypothetical protein KGO96_10595 [Elusimicrobia bacterium]|nr:hypothetical protein [Elusimicrobiota bacterium]
MASTVIDQLVVELGLDASKFSIGQQRALQDLRQFEQRAAQTSNQIQRGPVSNLQRFFDGLHHPIQTAHRGLVDMGEQAIRTGGQVSGAAAGMAYGLAGVAAAALTAFAALKGVQELMHATDRAAQQAQTTGYLAKWTGVSPEYMSRFAYAAYEKTGADVGQSQNWMYGLQQAITGYITPGTSATGQMTGVLDTMAKLGIPFVPDMHKTAGQNLQDAIAAISNKLAQQTPEGAQFIGGRLGMSRQLSAFMAEGAVAMNAAMQRAKLVQVTKDETDAAMKLLQAEREVSAETDKLARIFMQYVSPALEGFLDLLGYVEKKLIQLGVLKGDDKSAGSNEGFKAGDLAPKGYHWERDANGNYQVAPGNEPGMVGGYRLFGMTFGGSPPPGWYIDNSGPIPRMVRRVDQFSGLQPGSPGLQPGYYTGTGEGHTASQADRIAFARQYAISKGLNPDAIVATMAGEGLGRYVGDHGTSFGDFQLHVGGGMGDKAVAAGINIRDPNTWQAQTKYAIDQMAAHRGDASWYASQWHGAPAWAAQSFSSPGAATGPVMPPVEAPPTLGGGDSGVVAIGDSIARGFQRFGGAGGTGINLAPNDTTVNAAGGRTPSTILKYLKSLPDGALRGKRVVFSTGVSNDPNGIGLVPDQFKELRRLGASDVVVVGVGTKAGTEGGHYYDLNKYNSEISLDALAAGDKFLGGLPAVVHPSPGYYNRAMRRAALANVRHQVTNNVSRDTTHNHGDITVNAAPGQDIDHLAGLVSSAVQRTLDVANSNTGQE